MATGTARSGPQEVAASDGPRESLSQFVARVLDQLSLSAWFPAAALVLGLAFTYELATALASSPTVEPAPSPLETLSEAARRLADISLGGVLILFIAVVVLTIVTQAFAFESIRVLEGYWGTIAPIEWIAGWRRGRHSRKRRKLDGQYNKLTERAWSTARDGIERRRRQAADERTAAQLPSPNVMAVLGAQVLGEDRPKGIVLNDRETEILHKMGTGWEREASAELLRRRLNVDKKRRDYPKPNRTLPTRLGNILRAHEDATGEREVETFVQRVFDDLPASVKQEHDEHRTRLDLYCSMVFVAVVLASIAGLRLLQYGTVWTMAAVVVGLLGAWLMYRAALASARAYGLVLVGIARRVQNTPLPPDQPGSAN